MVSKLPDEMILKIVSYLIAGDYISFANTNQRFLHLLSSERKELNLFVGYAGNILATRTFLFGSPTAAAIPKTLSFANIKQKCLHLFSSVRKTFQFEGTITAVSTISKLDVGNCYWFDPSSLTQLISGLSSSLTSLHIQGTKLSSVQVAAILKECTKIDELSVSFFGDDPSFWLPGSNTTPSTYEGLKVTCQSSVFQDLVAKLNQLTRLSLYGNIDSYLNFFVFLRACKNLGSLHFELSSANDYDCHWDLSEIQGAAWRSIFHYFDLILPTFDSLTKVTCRMHNENRAIYLNLFGTFVAMVIHKIITNLSDVLWFPHEEDTIVLFPHLDREASAVKITNEEWGSAVLKYQGLNLIESLCIQPPHQPRLLMESTTVFPHLKLISCSYDPKAFLRFAKNHSNLKVLRFGRPLFPVPVAGEELAEGLIHLKSLQKFSMDPNYFQLCQVKRSYPDRQPYSLNDPLNLAITQLSKSCPFLNELEIGVFVTQKHSRLWMYRSSFSDYFTFQANSSALETLSQCSNLEILTLANLDVDSASFLHPILSGCRKLKSLRLTNLYSKADPVSFTQMMGNQLRTGLPLSRNLQDFRWEIGQSKEEFESPYLVVSSLPTVNAADLLDALKLCPSLQRMVLIADYTVGLNLSGTRALDWPSLVLACIISPTVDWENQGQLKITSVHPAFQICLGSSKREAAGRMAPHHFQEMIIFESRVAKMPY